MATHKSAEKRARQALRRNSRNSATKKAIRTIEKKLRTAIESKKGQEAVALLKEFTSKMDKAAQKGMVHVKTSARKISRLAQQVQGQGK